VPTATLFGINTLVTIERAHFVDRIGLHALRNLVTCSTVQVHTAGVSKIVKYT